MRAMVIREHGAPNVLRMEDRPVPELRDTDVLVARLVDAGLLRPHVSHRFPLERLAEGHAQAETGRTIGKVAILVNAADG